MALKKMPVFVAVFKDDEADIAMLECIEFTEILSGQVHPFIRIPINSLVDEILGREDGLKPEYSSKAAVDKSELDAVASTLTIAARPKAVTFPVRVFAVSWWKMSWSCYCKT